MSDEEIETRAPSVVISDVERVRAALDVQRAQTDHEVAERSGVPHLAVWNILIDLETDHEAHETKSGWISLA